MYIFTESIASWHVYILIKKHKDSIVALLYILSITYTLEQIEDGKKKLAIYLLSASNNAVHPQKI